MHLCTPVVLMSAALLVVQSCGTPQRSQALVAKSSQESAAAGPDVSDQGWKPGATLCSHHIEGPLCIDKSQPGLGLVFGTADFNANGSVLIKIQVEDLTTVMGTQATVTVWSGNGNAPGPGTTDPPPGGTQVYTSGGNVSLRYYTTHLDRTYDPSVDSYWLFAKVVHDNGDTRYVQHRWVPSQSSSPDTAQDFDSN